MPKHLSQKAVNNVKKMFTEENEYRKHMNNLWAIRSGLHKILEIRPELKDVISPQFKTLNILIDALLPDHPSKYPYPIYRD